jgi:hypothetical protein
MARSRYLTCVCGARKNTEGRCTAVPSCSDFEKPTRVGVEAAKRARAREQEATAHLGIDTAALSNRIAEFDPAYAASVEEAVRRAKVGWRGERRRRRPRVA